MRVEPAGRSVASARAGGARSASSGAAMPVVVAERLGQGHPAGLLDQGHQVDEAEAEAAVGLGDGQAGDPELGQGGPAGGPRPAGAS